MYKCAASNPVTQEVKTSGSGDRLRVRRKDQANLSFMGDCGHGPARLERGRRIWLTEFRVREPRARAGIASQPCLLPQVTTVEGSSVLLWLHVTL